MADITPYEIFFPNAAREYALAKENNIRFVHYTSAECAYKIIDGEQAWMRKSSTMNDLSEVRHGFRTIENSIKNPIFKDTLNKIFPELFEEVYDAFKGHETCLIDETYVFSVSVHGSTDQDEDLLGRLSMWRAYGQGNGIALVLNSAPFMSEDDDLGVFTSPVMYGNASKVDNELLNILANINKNIDLIRSIDRQHILYAILQALCFGATSLKHPGFKEEQEWRVLYNEIFSNLGLVKPTIEMEIIGGIPQKVIKIDLKEEVVPGLGVKDFINKILIGPTAHSKTLRESFINLLERKGVEQAEKKVVVSDIPLRV